MSRRMDYVIDLDKPAEALYESFTSRQYWDDLITIHEANALTEIVEFSHDENGTDIVFTHTMSRHNLPPIASAVVPIKIVVTRKQHFDAFNPESRSAKRALLRPGAGRTAGFRRQLRPGPDRDRQRTAAQQSCAPSKCHSSAARSSS